MSLWTPQVLYLLGGKSFFQRPPALIPRPEPWRWWWGLPSSYTLPCEHSVTRTPREEKHYTSKDISLVFTAVFAPTFQARPSHVIRRDDAAVFTLCYRLLTCSPPYLGFSTYRFNAGIASYIGYMLHDLLGIAITGLPPAGLCKLSGHATSSSTNSRFHCLYHFFRVFTSADVLSFFHQFTKI